MPNLPKLPEVQFKTPPEENKAGLAVAVLFTLNHFVFGESLSFSPSLPSPSTFSVSAGNDTDSLEHASQVIC